MSWAESGREIPEGAVARRLTDRAPGTKTIVPADDPIPARRWREALAETLYRIGKEAAQ